MACPAANPARIVALIGSPTSPKIARGTRKFGLPAKRSDRTDAPTCPASACRASRKCRVLAYFVRQSIDRNGPTLSRYASRDVRGGLWSFAACRANGFIEQQQDYQLAKLNEQFIMLLIIPVAQPRLKSAVYLINHGVDACGRPTRKCWLLQSRCRADPNASLGRGAPSRPAKDRPPC